MFKLRQAQVDVFAQAARVGFVDRMVPHLRGLFPDESQALGEEGLRKFIGQGIAKAAAHQIEIEDGVAKYLTLMLAFGPDFDKDPKCTWAQQVLKDPEIDDGALRADLLYEAAMDAASKAEGLDEEG